MTEHLEQLLAMLVTQNRQPCMSGDPRDRLSPLQRQQAAMAATAIIREVVTPQLVVEGYAGQLHANHHLCEGRVGFVGWPNLRDSVREEWREKARAYIAAMQEAAAQRAAKEPTP